MKLTLEDFRRPIGDDMLRTARSQEISQDERLEYLRNRSNFINRLLRSGHTQDPLIRLHALRLVGWNACLPSLETVAVEQPHCHDIAQAVVGNLTDVFRDVLHHEFKNYSKPDICHDNTIGCLGEMAVLGVTWWGIMDDPDRSHMYALPSTSEQDSSRKEYGYKTGSDIVVYDGIALEQYIQVKKSNRALCHSSERSNKNHPYRPDIAVISPTDLIDTSRDDAPLMLMDAMVQQDFAALTTAAAFVNASLDIAYERGNKYYTSL